MSSDFDPDRAGVIAPPPLVVFGGVLSGASLGRVKPWSIPLNDLSHLAGWAVILCGCALSLWGVTRMRHAGTAVNPARPTTALVRSGPYLRSRNPLYLSLLLIHGGIGVATGNLWILIALIPVWALLRWGVIAREERYLERKFGENYRQYRKRVRRWL